MNRKYIGAIILSLILVLPLSASAAVAASPGSTTTVFGLPVSERVTGLAADTVYYLDCETTASTEADQEVTSDSSGTLTVTCLPTVTGQNLYNLTITDGAGASQVTWTVDNMDIMPYIMILIYVSILFGIIGIFGGKSKGFF